MKGPKGRPPHAKLIFVSTKHPAKSGGSPHDPLRDESMKGHFGPDRPQAQTQKFFLCVSLWVNTQL